MNTKEYLSKVKKIHKAYDKAYGQESYSIECEDLNYFIEDLSSSVFDLTPQEVEKLNKALTAKIEEVDPTDKKTLHLLRQAQGYLQFYSHCPVDQLYFVREHEKQKDEFYNNSDWSKMIETFDLSDENKKFLELIMLHKELSFAYDKVLAETQCGYLCLNGFDHDALEAGLKSVRELRAGVCGPINPNENRYISYTEPNKVQGSDGNYKPEHYEQFIENSKKTIKFYTNMIGMFEQVKSQGNLKGYFFDYTKEETVQFVEQQISILNKNIEQINNNINKLSVYTNISANTD